MMQFAVSFFKLANYFSTTTPLRMARCDKPLVGHNPLACAGRTRKYMSYRLLLQSKARAKLDLENKMKWYYRNYFKCSLDLL